MEADLVARALAGDTDAFSELFERHRARIGRVCCSYVGKADAEDLVQAAFVTALERLPQLRDGERFGAWLNAIARSACLMWLRRRRVEAAMLQTAGQAGVLTPSGEDAALIDLRHEVHDALAELPPPERAAVGLFYLHGYTHQEIADQLRLPITTVKGRLWRGRERLRSLLLALDTASALVPPPADGGKERRAMAEQYVRSKAPMARILISDDSPIVMRLLMVNLLHQGYDALGTTWGSQTLDLACSWQPALVITDLHKGRRLDGFRIIRELRAGEKTRHIPILVVSADASQQKHADRARSCGADRVLTKPFDPKELLSIVGELLKGA